MSEIKKSGGPVSIYISDINLYTDLQTELKNKWFGAYGEALTKSEIIIKSMIYLRDILEKNNAVLKSNSPSINFSNLHRIFKS